MSVPVIVGGKVVPLLSRYVMAGEEVTSPVESMVSVPRAQPGTEPNVTSGPVAKIVKFQVPMRSDCWNRTGVAKTSLDTLLSPRKLTAVTTKWNVSSFVRLSMIFEVVGEVAGILVMILCALSFVTPGVVLK
jgi:hypothetical protein